MHGRLLTLTVALLPLAAVTGAYVVGARQELVPSCNPFLDGCTSISATGRYAPASYIFKPAHLVQAGLLALLWLRLARHIPMPRASSRCLRIAGLAGAAALVVYTLTLGTESPFYEFMRRFGIYVYFIGTVVAQVVVSRTLANAGRAAAGPSGQVGGRTLARGMLALCAAPLLLGAANFVFKATLADPDPMENRIEWIAALLMQAWFLLLYRYAAVTPRAAPSAGR